jgi:hypothetical protein
MTEDLQGVSRSEYIGWDYQEHPNYERGTLWYVFMTVVGLGLLIYAVATANFLFAFIIILFALVTYLASLNEPGKARFAVIEDGVRVGNRLYPFRQVRRFWFVYEPPAVKNLYLEIKDDLLQPRVIVALGEMNPNEVRTVLGQFIHEDFTETDEPMSDFLGRILKI